ncbi:MAG: hypothetical protein Q4G69_03380 [Planctomycetia bacterium]|nr:hypothetical protein [Planctomycetia bacterium]
MKKTDALRNILFASLLGIFLLGSIADLRAQGNYRPEYPRPVSRSEGMRFAFAPSAPRNGNLYSSPSAGAVWSTFLTGQYSPELIQWQMNQYHKKQGRFQPGNYHLGNPKLKNPQRGDSLAEARYRFLQQEIAMQEDILKRQRAEYYNLQREMAAIQYRTNQMVQTAQMAQAAQQAPNTQRAAETYRPNREFVNDLPKSSQRNTASAYPQNGERIQYPAGQYTTADQYQANLNKMAENRAQVQKRSDYLQMLRRMEFSLAKKETEKSSQNSTVRQPHSFTLAQLLTGRKPMINENNDYYQYNDSSMMAQTPTNPYYSPLQYPQGTQEEMRPVSGEGEQYTAQAGYPEKSDANIGAEYGNQQIPGENLLVNDGFEELETSSGSSNPVRLVSGSVRKEDLPQKRRPENENRKVYRPNGQFLP